MRRRRWAFGSASSKSVGYWYKPPLTTLNVTSRTSWGRPPLYPCVECVGRERVKEDQQGKKQNAAHFSHKKKCFFHAKMRKARKESARREMQTALPNVVDRLMQGKQKKSEDTLRQGGRALGRMLQESAATPANPTALERGNVGKQISGVGDRLRMRLWKIAANRRFLLLVSDSK